MRSDLPGQAKLDLMRDFDRLFGLDLDEVPADYEVPEAVLTSPGAPERVAGASGVSDGGHAKVRGAVAGIRSGGYRADDTDKAEDRTGAATGAVAVGLLVAGSGVATGTRSRSTNTRSS